MGGETINRRTVVLTVAFGLLFAALTARLFYIQIIQHHHLTQIALRQQERTIEIQPSRGAIYDRAGRPLALNRSAASWFAVPSEVKNASAAAARLAPVVGLSASRLERRLRSRKAFVWISRKTTDATAARIRNLQLPGIHELAEPRRVYPEGNLASHVLGFVGMDNQGLGGIELQFDRLIRGQSGWMRITRDAKGRQVPVSAKVNKPPEPGQDVYLTLDKMVQHIAERELEQGIALSRAKQGSVVVMDPQTGDVLALANKPDFDPNQFARYSSAVRRNRAITDVFEPGSTFKVVAASAALEEKVFQTGQVIDCEMGRGVFGGRVVRDHEPRGRLSFEDVVVFSSNIGMVKIGLTLGSERLHHYAQRYGFGRLTGIELPGEAGGLLKPSREWSPSTTASISFGQGVAVTVLQMAAAYAAVANQGRLPKPHIVKELRSAIGVSTHLSQTDYREQAISAGTAKVMREILQDAVARGTGTQAEIAQYNVAGKTGTAQKPLNGRIGYDPVNHIASFIGFFPAEAPRVLIAVVIDEPQGIQWGGQVAGPIFREVGRQVVAYLSIPPGPQKIFALAQTGAVPPAEARSQAVSVPDLTGLSIAESGRTLKNLGLKALCAGKGRLVQAQRPWAGEITNRGSAVVLYTEGLKDDVQTDARAKRVVVPDLAGQSLRDALQILANYGLHAQVTGSGVVRSQKPSPESWTRVGSTCVLACQDPEGLP